MNLELVSFECNCKRRKKFRLTLDGGSSGKYILELCSDCYADQNKKFLLKEEEQ